MILTIIIIMTIVKRTLPTRIPNIDAPIASVRRVSSIRLCDKPIKDRDRNVSFFDISLDFASFTISPPPYARPSVNPIIGRIAAFLLMPKNFILGFR